MASNTGRDAAPGTGNVRSRTCWVCAKPGTLKVVQPSAVRVVTPLMAGAAMAGASFARSSVTALAQAVSGDSVAAGAAEVARDSDDET